MINSLFSFAAILNIGSATRRAVYNKKFNKIDLQETLEKQGGAPHTELLVGLSNIENGKMVPTLWGHKFEPVARQVASLKFFKDKHKKSKFN